MAGIDPGFFIGANFLILSILLMAIRAIFPNARIMRIALAITGLYLLYLVAPRFAPFYVLFWVLVWACQYIMRIVQTVKAPVLATAITTAVTLLILSPMLLRKLFTEHFTLQLNETFSKLLWTLFPQVGFADAIIGLVIPIGLSFAIFRALDLLFKVRLDVFKPLSLDRVLFFGLFPPVLAVGPIIEYEEVALEGRLNRAPNPGDISVGLMRVFLGVTKIFLFSVLLNHLAGSIWPGHGDTTFVNAWAGVLVYGLFFYVNFSGYSDVSIGASRVLGFRLKENFDNPYFKTNMSSFWNAWHMSLTRWVFRYVFIPLGGMRAHRQYVAIFMTIMVIALWHGITVSMFIFGIYHGLALVVYRYIDGKRMALKKPLSKNRFVKMFKMLCVFVFFSLSVPLQALATNEILPFYANFIPGLN